MNDYIEKLRKQRLNLIIMKDDSILFQSREEGMKPLYQAIENLGLSVLENTIVIDKIIGKAAALIIHYFKAKEIHCILLSTKGKDYLERHKIPHYWERITNEISNRYGTDICPFEKAVQKVEDPFEGYQLVYNLLKEMKIYQ